MTKGLKLSMILRINEVPFVPNSHTVLFSFEVIGPDGRFNEGSGSIIAKIIDCKGNLPEVNRGFGIELIESDFSDSCCQHMSNIPPRENECWKTGDYEQFEHLKSIMNYNNVINLFFQVNGKLCSNLTINSISMM